MVDFGQVLHGGALVVIGQLDPHAELLLQEQETPGGGGRKW